MGWSGYLAQPCVGMHKHLHLIRYTGVCVVRIHCEMNIIAIVVVIKVLVKISQRNYSAHSEVYGQL